MIRRLSLLSLPVLALAGCYKLDPFLYTPHRTEAYEFELEGDDASDTITADRLEQFTVPVNAEISLGAIYVHANEPTPRAYAMFFHGKGDHLGGQFERAKRLANLGYDVFAVDPRGFGISTNVAPTEDGVDEDTAAAYQFLVNRVGGSERIFFYGHSWGTAVGTQRAVEDPPKVLILESGFASVDEFKTDATGLDFPDEYIADDGWETSKRLRDVHVPVLIMHGLEDDFVRPEFSDVLYGNANQPKRLEKVAGADHGSIPRVLGPEFGNLVHGWVEQAIAAQP